ncbi:type II secretion system F family protein [Candidatus Laterigemmans baculatus]|uniref:type II secretion system F family protein n=1 Tax=Candidatus Laterigemmans baculatus TaxID=2770505 RepID=UPI0013DA4BB7|nr:type II secretion system F family protein [Candidatus Laterigemmans baculatus]
MPLLSAAPRRAARDEPQGPSDDFHSPRDDFGYHDASDGSLEEGDAPLRGRIPTGSLLLVITQLAVMCQNGIDLAEAMETAAKHSRHPVLADRLRRIFEAINGGSSLSSALTAHGDGLPATLPALVAAGESTGEVPQALRRLSEMLRSEMQLRSTIVGALIYPVILILVASAVSVAMLFGVLPRFGEVFSTLGRPVPASTAILLDFGLWARTHWMPVVGGLFGSVAVLWYFRRHPLLRQGLDRFLLFAPPIRSAYRPLATGRMFRFLGTLTHGGVPLLQAIRLTREATSNSYFVALLEEVEEDILSGDLASRALAASEFLPPEAAQMVATAERTGRLPEVLSDCGEFYEEEGARVLRKLVVSLEPVIILGMGVLVAGVVLSIMLPLLDISSVA